MSGVGNPDHVQLTRCHRLICAECVTQYHQDLMKCQASGKSSCPICFDSNCIEGPPADENLEDGNSSLTGVDRKTYPSKLMALLKDIETNPLQEKSIVFSCWKKTLDIIGRLFMENGVVCVRVDGSLSPGQRRAVMLEFQNNSRAGVLLMTLGTGAVELNNLSIASRIYLLEPQWNPFVENQAIGRVFRLGQTKPVHVIRYVLENTIEQALMDFQSEVAIPGPMLFDDEGFPRRIRMQRLCFAGLCKPHCTARIFKIQKPTTIFKSTSNWPNALLERAEADILGALLLFLIRKSIGTALLFHSQNIADSLFRVLVLGHDQLEVELQSSLNDNVHSGPR